MLRRVALLFCLLTLTGWAQDFRTAGINDAAGAKKFFYELQRAVAHHRKLKVASMIAYPLQVYCDGKRLSIADSKALLQSYDQVFNAKVKKALAEQSVDKLCAREQGVRIGTGEIWFHQFWGRFRITAVNN